eukprot:c7185_g1_i1.p1 GENE.c7185_g1_i1~~c7185_g1_i1.p1  ORF type:complete len:286 (-),score=38.34 c7185_g1_i1:141-959(-)
MNPANQPWSVQLNTIPNIQPQQLTQNPPTHRGHVLPSPTPIRPTQEGSVVGLKAVPHPTMQQYAMRPQMVQSAVHRPDMHRQPSVVPRQQQQQHQHQQQQSQPIQIQSDWQSEISRWIATISSFRDRPETMAYISKLEALRNLPPANRVPRDLQVVLTEIEMVFSKGSQYAHQAPLHPHQSQPHAPQLTLPVAPQSSSEAQNALPVSALTVQLAPTPTIDLDTQVKRVAATAVGWRSSRDVSRSHTVGSARSLLANILEGKCDFLAGNQVNK